MARVTVEDCLENVDNRFELVLVASKRARQIAMGKEALVEVENDKPTVIALREIADDLVNAAILNEEPEVAEEEEEVTLETEADAEVKAEVGATAGAEADGEVPRSHDLPDERRLRSVDGGPDGGGGRGVAGPCREGDDVVVVDSDDGEEVVGKEFVFAIRSGPVCGEVTAGLVGEALPVGGRGFGPEVVPAVATGEVALEVGVGGDGVA